MLRRAACVLLILLAGVSCSRDPEVVKKKYLQSGNRYFEKAKFKEAYIMYRNALNKDPKYAEAYYRLGLTVVKMGQPLAAIREFKRAADSDPNFTIPDARVQAGNILLMAYVANPDRPAALTDDIKFFADQLLKHNPKSAPGLRLDGYVKWAIGKDIPGAIQRFRDANAASPSRDVQLPLVQVLLDSAMRPDAVTGRRPEAAAQRAEAEKLGRDILAKDKTFGQLYDVLYDDFIRSNRVAEAEAILKEKAANNPKDGDTLVRLAYHYYHFQRPSDMQAALDKLTHNEKDLPDGHFKAGRFYEIIHDYDSAMREFQQGIKRQPDHKAAFQKNIVQVLLAQNTQDKKDEAVRLLNEILRANPKDGAAEAMRASLLIDTGDPKQVKQAVTELQTAVNQDQRNPVLRFNLGRGLLARNQLAEAMVQFKEAVKLRPEYLPAHLALAQIHMARREHSYALQEAQAILTYDPRDIAAKLVRSSAFLALGNVTDARTEVMDALRLAPNAAEARLQLAMLDLATKRYKEAEDGFKALHQALPGDLRALMGLTETYAVQAQWQKAEDALQNELTKLPGRLELRSALGNIAYRAKNYDLAIQQYQALIQARPDAGDVYLRLGQTYRDKKDTQSALRSFEKAAQLRPNDPRAFLQLALTYEAVGDRAKARPIYDQVLKLDPDNPIALNNTAYLIAESGGDLDQALALSQRARQKMPQQADVADTLGWIYIKKNLSDNAIEIFRDLVTKHPESSTFRYHLGMALYQRGDKPQAKKELQSALERKPNSEEAAKIRQLMAKIG